MIFSMYDYNFKNFIHRLSKFLSETKRAKPVFAKRKSGTINLYLYFERTKKRKTLNLARIISLTGKVP